VGRLNSQTEQRATLDWASGYRGLVFDSSGISTLSDVRKFFAGDLRSYFALAALSRSTTAPAEMVGKSLSLVFRVRVALERSIGDSVTDLVSRAGLGALGLEHAPLHGCSKKQGVSIRMPLSSCVPSKICGAACYAHDVLDAAPASVVRGAVNGAIASGFEQGDRWQRDTLLCALGRSVRRMIQAARRDARVAASSFERRPRIRFAHVGEFAPFPNFANALARLVRDSSNGDVDCVVYTRHPDAKLLDPELFVVLFSLDESSEDRRRFVPATAKVVRSAFGGQITDSVDVNFLEHHRWIHIKPVGSGKVCPATAPETKVRTCDSCRCDFCFRRPDSKRFSVSSDPGSGVVSTGGDLVDSAAKISTADARRDSWGPAPATQLSHVRGR
jgi:hypothetical protein